MNLDMVHNGMNFSTYDRDNDMHGSINCAVRGPEGGGGGGWWYRYCVYFNLNGHYGKAGFSVYCSNRWNYFSASRMMLKRE